MNSHRLLMALTVCLVACAGSHSPVTVSRRATGSTAPSRRTTPRDPVTPGRITITTSPRLPRPPAKPPRGTERDLSPIPHEQQGLSCAGLLKQVGVELGAGIPVSLQALLVKTTPLLVTTISEDDRDGDGIPESREWSRFDSQQRLHYLARQRPGGKMRLHTRNSYDQSGHLLLQTRDDDGDGTVDVTIAQLFNGDGQLASRTESHFTAANAAPTSVSTTTYEYRPDGLLSRINTPQGYQAFSYDADERLLGWIEDRDGDGTIDAGSRTLYHPDGEKKSVSYFVGLDNAGLPLGEFLLGAWDEAGRELRFAISPTVFRLQTYDADGRLIRVEKSSNDDPQIDSVTEVTYDALGQLLEMWVDNNNDGLVDQRTTVVYGENSRTTERRNGAGDILFSRSIDRKAGDRWLPVERQRNFWPNALVRQRGTFIHDQQLRFSEITEEQWSEEGTLLHLDKELISYHLDGAIEVHRRYAGAPGALTATAIRVTVRNGLCQPPALF